MCYICKYQRYLINYIGPPMSVRTYLGPGVHSIYICKRHRRLINYGSPSTSPLPQTRSIDDSAHTLHVDLEHQC